MSKAISGNQVKIVDVTHNSSKIYVRAVKGKIETLRRYTGLVFLALFSLLPWVTYQGQQAILLDFVAQRFHLFGLTLWPQDLTLLAWLFIVSAFALFFVTALWGRVWCGFMCPQTVFTFLFVWVEEKIEGARNKRIHLDAQPWSIDKVVKKVSKHGAWTVISLITAFTFVGYFTPIRPFFVEIVSFELTFWPVLFVLFFALCTYGNAGWMREVMCTHMCPYSRFQSSMFDNDTLTVTYDKQRGEGRGPRPKKLSKAEYQQKGLGDCIDCNLCVQVCPTGIDIRNGLQYECINCGACVDACNGVMSNMGYEKGLIAFTSENALKGKKTSLLRPKVIGYLLVLIVMVSALVLDVVMREPLDIDVIRDRTSLYRETINGDIENVYTLVIMNKTQHEQRVKISIQGLTDGRIQGLTDVIVPSSQLIKHPISVAVSEEYVQAGTTPFSIIVSNEDGEGSRAESTFISPF
jgi:cytochrome c oxidase accessory protein FixG